MKKKILFLIPILAVLLSSVNVKAEVITPAGGWQLSTFQYAEGYHENVDSVYTYKSYVWGQYILPDSWRYVYKIGAYVDNAICQTDYCILPGNTYVFNMTYTSSGNIAYYTRFMEKQYFNFHLSYGTSKKWLAVGNGNISYLLAKKIDNNTLQLSFVVNIPDLPSDSDTIEFTSMDIWYDFGFKSQYFNYTGSSDSFYVGLSNFNVSTDVDSHINSYEQYYSDIRDQQQNDQIIGGIGETNDKLDGLQGAIGETNDKLDGVQDSIGETNDKLDDMINADSSATESPDDSGYDDYESAEGDLKDKVNQADLTNLSIGIDSKSSSWVWDTLTRLIQSSSAVFSMIISILSIGVIKLALGR